MDRYIYPLLFVQVFTFVALGVVYIIEGQYRLGIAQMLLAAVQAVIYTGNMQ